MRILSISDLHCGNITGLTHPDFNPDSPVGHELFLYRQTLYNWFKAEVELLKPIDLCVVNGDAVAGKEFRGGGREAVDIDRNNQVEMAVKILREIGAERYAFTYGSPYHVGRDDDWEEPIAAAFNAPIQDVYTESVEGLRMRWRHHISRSTSTAYRATALLKRQIDDVLWTVDHEFEKADVLLYSHTHYFQAFSNRIGMVFTHPGLQGLGGSFIGGRYIGDTIDFGFLHFDVNSREEWTWQLHRLVQTAEVRHGQVVA